MGFAQSPSTATRSYGAKDFSLPPMGAIPFNPGGLSAQEMDRVNGNVKIFIKGDVQYHLNGNLDSTVEQNEKLLVKGNKTAYLKGNLIDTIHGTCTETKNGKHFHTNSSERTNTFIKIRQQYFHASTFDHLPETHFQNFLTKINWENETHKMGFLTASAFALYFAANLVKVDLNVTKVDVCNSKIEAKQIKAAISNMSMKIRMQTCALTLAGAMFGAIHFGTPFKPNALPRPTPITPFD